MGNAWENYLSDAKLRDFLERWPTKVRVLTGLGRHAEAETWQEAIDAAKQILQRRAARPRKQLGSPAAYERARREGPGGDEMRARGAQRQRAYRERRAQQRALEIVKQRYAD